MDPPPLKVVPRFPVAADPLSVPPSPLSFHRRASIVRCRLVEVLLRLAWITRATPGAGPPEEELAL